MPNLWLLTLPMIRLGGWMWLTMPHKRGNSNMEAICWEWWPIEEIHPS